MAMGGGRRMEFLEPVRQDLTASTEVSSASPGPWDNFPAATDTVAWPDEEIPFHRNLALTAGLFGCGSLSIQQTEHKKSNPYIVFNRSLGLNYWVDPPGSIPASVKVVEIKDCLGGPIFFRDTPIPSLITLEIVSKPGAPLGFSMEAACAIWNATTLQWTMDGVQIVPSFLVSAG
ncbi:unnamed protein product, partial [Polarella glacialis]